MTGTSPPRLILHFVADNIGLDNNRDLFVWAFSAEEAEDHWRKHYETSERPDGLFAVPTENPTSGPVLWDSIRTEMLT